MGFAEHKVYTKFRECLRKKGAKSDHVAKRVKEVLK